MLAKIWRVPCLVSHGDEQEVRRSARAHQRSPVTDRRDQAVEPLQLQAIVKGVPEPVRPMHQRQGEHSQQPEPGQWMAKHRQQMAVIRR